MDLYEGGHYSLELENTENTRVVVWIIVHNNKLFSIYKCRDMVQRLKTNIWDPRSTLTEGEVQGKGTWFRRFEFRVQSAEELTED
jgi:hypothetical protein